MITVLGLNGIKATVLAHSINKAGHNLITWEIEYPRLILAELNTHRMLSRNSFSSRAVPFNKMLEQLTGEPVRFGANQPGMQDKGEDYDVTIHYHFQAPMGAIYGEALVAPRTAWAKAKQFAISFARGFSEAGYHKQVYNRLLEPWQMQKTVVSATEVDNFFWLRDDDAADPTIRELTRVMREAMEASRPRKLNPGEWHLPYIDVSVNHEGKVEYSITMEDEHGIQWIPLSTEEAIKVSCARCAAVSYRNEGYDLEKSIDIYNKLVGSDKKHASAFEHCATPMQGEHNGQHWTENVNVPTQVQSWEGGVTHMDRDLNLWSGNFKGFIQYRKLIPGECYNGQ
jgi:thymidylate synthase ThyX